MRVRLWGAMGVDFAGVVSFPLGLLGPVGSTTSGQGGYIVGGSGVMLIYFSLVYIYILRPRILTADRRLLGTSHDVWWC